MNELKTIPRNEIKTHTDDTITRRPIIVIIGMHRSGTSLCSSIIQTLGIEMATELDALETQPKGHYERWDLVEIHDKILACFDRSYFSLAHDYP